MNPMVKAVAATLFVPILNRLELNLFLFYSLCLLFERRNVIKEIPKHDSFEEEK
jgi:hypothetical protein